MESLDDLVTEVVDDLYLARFGREREQSPLTYDQALRLARKWSTTRRPNCVLVIPSRAPAPRCASNSPQRLETEMEIRKRRRGILGYDDLLSRLADALAEPDAPARVRMSERWPIVMVDEFQDTDPVQWRVIDCAFSGSSTLVLIGDPKAGDLRVPRGDIVTYLKAAETAGEKQTLVKNWRSDAALVERLQTVLGVPRSATRASSCTTSNRSTTAAGSPVPRAAIPSGCAWCPGSSSGAAEPRRS